MESAGGRLESAVEPIDTQTAAGRLSRGMLLEIAAFESEVIGETWQAVHRQRRENGLPHHGPQRLGYSYTRQSGYLVDDQADIVRELYARFTSGEGLSTLTSWLLAEGVTGAHPPQAMEPVRRRLLPQERVRGRLPVRPRPSVPVRGRKAARARTGFTSTARMSRS